MQKPFLATSSLARSDDDGRKIYNYASSDIHFFKICQEQQKYAISDYFRFGQKLRHRTTPID